MKPVVAPINPGDQSPKVANLQAGLISLLRDEFIQVDASRRAELLRALEDEMQGQEYRDATKDTVTHFQEQQRLESNGEVDEATAEALNAALREIGALNGERAPRVYAVSGQVRREDGLLLTGLVVRATHESEGSAIRLGEDTTDAEGRYTIRYEPLPGLSGVDLRVSALGEEGTPLQSSDLIRQAKAVEIVNLTVAAISKARQRGIEGRVIFEDGRPAEQLTLRLYQREFGGSATSLGETKTLVGGVYAFAYDLEESAASLEIRTLENTSDEIPLSKPLNDLGEQAVVNLVAPTSLSPLAAEYERLVDDLIPHIGEMKRLAEAQENHERQDLTVLNRATGWDARLIALAATAERLSADQAVNLPQEGLYGLLRAGLPSDKLLLAQVEPDVAEQALKTVSDAGVVALDDRQIGEFKETFTAFRDKVRLDLPAPGSRSTYGGLLKASGISEDAQRKFASVYLNHRGNATRLWEEAGRAGLERAQIRTLQLEGKLAFLAGNSEGMTTRLMQQQIIDPVQLVEQGFYRAEAWKVEVFEQANIPADRRDVLTGEDKKKLDVLIPANYAGEKVEDRLDAYAEDMARKVRLSYPTQVLADQIENDEIFKPLAGAAAVTLLKNAVGQGFRLGDTPVDAFLKTHTGVPAGVEEKDLPLAHRQISALQRVYQITPSNEAIPVLMDLGISSAFDVMAYSPDVFESRYVDKYFEIHKKNPPSSETKQIPLKAQQVSSVIYNLFTVAKKLDSDLPVAGMAASAEVRKSVKNGLIKQFPTMESLFGSMDFCECEHCRSVLSPAAYLVDLLQTLEEWGTTRSFPKRFREPYDVLIERRPDLPHIPLTCENTHTALPYIDVVNEILEYYVAKGKLEENAAHDTGEATTAELLAEPQNVIREAYDHLHKARYPLNLPFDLWIETVRQFCNYFETPLHELLETFRASNDLFAPTQTFDRASVFMESLGLAPAEVAIFTDPDLLSKWYELYGYPTESPTIQTPGTEVQGIAEYATLTVADADAAAFGAGDLCTYFDTSANSLHDETKAILTIGDPGSGGPGRTKITFEGKWDTPPDPGDRLVFDAPATLRSAKALSRRLGVTYKEIVEIVQTGFVNPELTKLAVLYKLGVSIRDARLYKEHKPFYEQNKDLIDTDRSALQPADQQRFDELAKEVPNTQFTGWEIVNELAELEQRLTMLAAEFNTPLNELQTLLQNIPFDKVLELLDPDTGCNFDLTTLQYADGTKAKPIDFLRINLFVRLWRKLGWSIEETDRALSTFVPQKALSDGASLARWLETALIYLAHLKALDEKIKFGKQSRIKLLTLWSDIPTTGKQPLYAQLFLTRSVLKADPMFDHPLGRYLSASWIAVMAQSRKHRVQLENVPLADKIDAALFAAEPKVELSYDELQEVQYLSFEGVLSDAEKAALSALSPSSVLSVLLDAVQRKAREFSLIKGHSLALQGALGLTADEVGRILEDAGKSLDTAELSLPNVSLLYRYGLLAKALKLSVPELIALKQLSGRDPFKPLHSDPLTKLEDDHPFSQTLRFIEIAEEVKDSGLKIEDLDYLLRHRFDETDKYRPNREGTLALLKMLAEGVRAIRAEHAVPNDPGAISEEVLRQKLGLVLPPDVVERFLAMMNGTAEFTATKTVNMPTEPLKPEEFTDEPAIREVRYSGTHQEQKLTVRLFDPHRAGLEARHPSTLFAELMQKVEVQARDFFDNQLKKQKLRLDDEAGFLDAGDFSELFDPLKPLLKMVTDDSEQEIADKQKENEKIESDNQVKLETRRNRIAQAYLPFLQQRLIRQFIIQTLQGYTGTDPVLVEGLLSDERLLGGTKPLLNAFATVSERGINATFYSGQNFNNEISLVIVVTDADTGLKVRAGNKLIPVKPATADSVEFEGYLSVPVSGAYRFYVELDKMGAAAELHFNHLSQSRFLAGVAAADNDVLGDEPEKYLELKGGVPYRFSLKISVLNGGDVRLRLQGEILPKGSISQLPLYPAGAMAEAERALLLLTKSIQIVQSLGLSEREIRYLLTHAKAFGGLSLNELPTQSSTDTPAEKVAATERFTGFLRLVTYARLKRDLATGTDDLIDIFEADETVDPDKRDKKVYPLIAKLTRRDEATIKAAAKALFSKNPDFAGDKPFFTSEKPLQRMWQALQVVERFGVPVAALLEWTRIVSSAASPAQRFEITRGLKEAIKARFEPETWQRVAQPIFDKLRQRQRDALVSHVIHRHGFARMEQLYEYFLIDPGMEPVVQTSRIRLAIASVQLFIQRCLLNLESKVHPSVINSKQWEWMKRYRVWEANRKIFLFPENWLEPEFRDDKTHLFSELEGALLQGDVSNDLVEDAFLNYLKKLDELARLDIVAMHVEEVDTVHRILHVFGRTYSQPHKYFYRRYVQQMWTPWEPVSTEIQGDHLAPVVWRDRLYLFWVTFMEKAKTTSNPTPIDPTKPIPIPPVETEMEAQLHWSEYLQGEWTTRESGEFSPLESQKLKSISVDPRRVFVFVSKEPYDEMGMERGVFVHLSWPFNASFYLAGRNSIPKKGAVGSLPSHPYTPAWGTETANATRYRGSGPLKVTFAQRITTTETGWAPGGVETPSILSQGQAFTLLPCNNDLELRPSAETYENAADPDAVKEAIRRGLAGIASLMKPVFYQDSQRTLFVEPNVTERTIEEWQEWVTPTPQPEPEQQAPDWWEELLVIPEIPRKWPIPDLLGPRISVEIDPKSRIQPKLDQDWLVNPGTVLAFGDALIGPLGQPGLQTLTSEVADGVASVGTPVHVNPGSGIASGTSIALVDSTTLEQAGLTQTAGGLNVIGRNGFNSALKQNFNEANRSGFGARMPGAGRINR